MDDRTTPEPISLAGAGLSDLNEADIGTARLSPRDCDPEGGDLLTGGDADAAPASLTAAAHHPQSASSGLAWDDPDEL